MALVTCPFCLKQHDFTTFTTCPELPQLNLEIPPVYIKEYRSVRPLWLVTAGFSRHGKSCYLNALIRLLEEISKVWGKVFYRPLDQFTFDNIRRIRRDAQSGVQPDKTLLNEITRPMLLSVYNLPHTGSRCLVMYDVAGEVYDSLTDTEEYAASIKEVTTTWFLVSLSDLDSTDSDQQGKTITDLFTVYLSGMERMRSDLRGRNLIVIYTKGDKFAPREREIRDYLTNDPLKGLLSVEAAEDSLPKINLEDYLQGMQEISDKLREYTQKRVKGGSAFINMVEASGMKLVFSVVSALGSDPDRTSRRSDSIATPMRVIDPFLWAIVMENEDLKKSLALALDASDHSEPVYSSELPSRVASILAGSGALTTHYLGQLKPASQPGQAPPTAPPRTARPRLLGPVLESLPSNALVLVITNGAVLDLTDFRTGPWRNRIVVATLGSELAQDWPNTITVRPEDDPRLLADAALSLP
jgi:hypothetical protein